MSWLRVAAALALAALVGALGVGVLVWRGSEQLLRPEGYAHAGRAAGPLAPDPRGAAGIDFEDVRFPTDAGSELAGWFIPPQQPSRLGLVLVHGAGSDRRSFLDHLPFLHAAGYALLAIDLRDHGASDGSARGHALGYRELHDVSAAVRYLKRERGLARVAAFGISLGGDAVILAAAGDREIDVAIAESPFASVQKLLAVAAPRAPEALRRAIADLALLRVGALGEPTPLEAVGRIAPTPLVLIASADDRLVPAAQVEALYAAAREPKEIWVAVHGEHGAILAAEPKEYAQRLLTYLARWLGPPPAAELLTAAPPGPAQ